MLLEVANLNSGYGHVKVLRDVSLGVQAGETVALIGANGAGKTTLLRTLSGILRPSAGSITFDSHSIEHWSSEQIVSAGVIHIPERRQLFGAMTVRDNLLLGAYHRHDDAIAQDLARAYDIFPILKERTRQIAGTLSGGQQQMLAIARGLMGRPRLLLLDEPSVGLAPMIVREIMSVVVDLRAHGTTILLVEQNARAALGIADRGYVLENGQITLEGSAKKLMADENVQRAYLGKAKSAGFKGGRMAKNIRQTPLIWNKEAETMARGDLEKLQLQRLQATAARVYNHVPFYKKAFDALGVKPGAIKALSDLARLPFTTKQDLRDNYPFGMLSIPRDQVVRIHASSGTTGKPTVGAYSPKDMDVWAETMARVYTAAGVTNKDTVHNAYGHGLFTGGLGFHLGAEKIGATVVPISIGLTKRQVMLLEDFGATVLTCTPSYSLVIAEAAAEAGVDMRSRMKLRVGIFGAEPWTDEMRAEVEAKVGLEAFDIYGLTEMIGPGVSVECPYHDGLHVAEDHFLPEVVNPDTGAPVGEGQIGELVFTSITREAMPLIRYRTRDRVLLTREQCACGRTMARMSKVRGRTDDMLIIRGVNVFPSNIESVTLSADGVEPHYLILVDRQKSQLDELEVWVEASLELWNKGEYFVKETEKKIAHDLLETLGVSAKVKVTEPHGIQRSEGKARRIIDRRELGM